MKLFLQKLHKHWRKWQRYLSHCNLCLQVIATDEDWLCDSCRQKVLSSLKAQIIKPSIPHSPFVYTFAPYRFPMRQIILNWKFKYPYPMQRTLDQIVQIGLTQLEYMKQDWQKPDALIPVPMHPHKETSRRFHQTQMLAQIIGNYWSIPVLQDIIAKTVHTKAQSSLTHADRAHNLSHTFQLLRPIDSKRYKLIWLIDDVLTTGHTLTELAQTIRLQSENPPAIAAFCLSSALN